MTGHYVIWSWSEEEKIGCPKIYLTRTGVPEIVKGNIGIFIRVLSQGTHSFCLRVRKTDLEGN
jgi:hypothetical protein